MDAVTMTVFVYVTSVIVAGAGQVAYGYFASKVARLLFRRISQLKRSQLRMAVYISSSVRVIGMVAMWACVVLFIPVGIEWSALVCLVNIVIARRLRTARRKTDHHADIAIESSMIGLQGE